MAAAEVFEIQRNEWCARCDDLCRRPLHLTTDNWHDAYEVALGHVSLLHPRERGRS